MKNHELVMYSAEVGKEQEVFALVKPGINYTPMSTSFRLNSDGKTIVTGTLVALELGGWLEGDWRKALEIYYLDITGEAFPLSLATRSDYEHFYWRLSAEGDQVNLDLLLQGSIQSYCLDLKRLITHYWFMFDADDYLNLRCYCAKDAEYEPIDLQELYYDLQKWDAGK